MLEKPPTPAPVKVLEINATEINAILLSIQYKEPNKTMLKNKAIRES